MLPSMFTIEGYRLCNNVNYFLVYGCKDKLENVPFLCDEMSRRIGLRSHIF